MGATGRLLGAAVPPPPPGCETGTARKHQLRRRRRGSERFSTPYRAQFDLCNLIERLSGLKFVLSSRGRSRAIFFNSGSLVVFTSVVVVCVC